MNILPSKPYTNLQEATKLIKNNIKGILINVRSLRKNIDETLVAIDNILEDLDFIYIVEINIEELEKNLFQIKGFRANFLNRNNRKGGGIAVFVKKDIPYEVKYPNSKCFESILLCAKISSYLGLQKI